MEGERPAQFSARWNVTDEPSIRTDRGNDTGLSHALAGDGSGERSFADHAV